jgi:histidinol-phosphate aminotransferase
MPDTSANLAKELASGHDSVRAETTQKNQGALALAPAPRARVRAMKEYHPPLGDRSAMRLDFNENTIACSPAVRDALGRIAAGDLTRYPEREPVEALVAQYLGLPPAQIALTNGVDEAIHVLFEAFLDEGDELLLPVPTYTMYEVYSSATDANVVTVQAADDLQFPYERLLAAITPRTKIIAIANPNSPSGSIATREQIIEIARRAPHAIVLVDEAYFHFYGQTVLDLIGVQPNTFGTLPNVIVTRTFSKAYGLAGLRVGVIAAPVELMQWIRRVLSPYSVNSVALACLPTALADTSYIDWYVNEVLAARSEFECVLDQLNVRRWPSQANFVLVHIGPAHREFVRLMNAAGVLVRDRSADPGCDGRVRITIGTREQMQRAAEVLRSVVATLRAQGDMQ